MKKQNRRGEVLPLRVASPWKRLLAYSLDIILITSVTVIIAEQFPSIQEIMATYFQNRQDIEARIAFLSARNNIRDIAFIVWILYSFFMDASKYQGTLGKVAMKLKVIDEKGQRITLARSLRRNSSKLLSAILLGLGFIWILFNKKHQGWHDMIAKTLVVDSGFFS